MSSANLNGSLKRLVQKTVIDRNQITMLQVRCDSVDALECSLIEHRLIARPLDEHEFVAVETYKFLCSITDQAHRHSVQQFVGKIDAREWFRRLSPLDLIVKRLEHPTLLRFQNWKWLEYPVAQRVEEFRETLLQELQDIPRELTVVRPPLDNDEIIHLAEALPDF